MSQLEIWKPIKDYPKYEVSSLGRIKSSSRDILKGHIVYKNKKPCQVTVYLTKENGEKKNLSVHRLVLEAFTGLCPAGYEGCHNDGDGTNNALTNLRWDTHKANMQDSIIHGTFVRPIGFKKGHSIGRGETNNFAALTEIQVKMIKILFDQDFTLRQIAEAFGVNETSIQHIKYNRT